MTRNFRLVAFCLISFGFSLPAIGQDQALKKENKNGEWIQLFNGKNLDGWTPKIRFHELGENYKKYVSGQGRSDAGWIRGLRPI